MKIFKTTALLLALCIIISLCGCAKPDKNFGVPKTESKAETQKSVAFDDNKITSLDSVMSKYFDITQFDEENYSNIYLGADYKLNAVYCNKKFVFPAKVSDLKKDGWNFVDDSDYDENSLIYAKETTEVVFSDKYSNTITALFYNSLNTSVRLADCSIVKFHIKNNHIKNPDSYSTFNVNGITNSSVVTDIFEVLGTPSHFYKKSENSYYFDYFFEKSDRRNKIRVYANLNYDVVTEVEFSNYK